METKICTKCSVEYPATKEWFHADKKSKYGITGACKKCRHLTQKKWRTENPERCKEAQKKWCIENPERYKEAQKKWRIENPERRKATKRKWIVENPEKVQYAKTKERLKKQIGAPPPPELVEIKVLINKTKKLCKTLKN